MKLHDCDCGGIPRVTYETNDNIAYAVVCAACGNQTPICESLREAVAHWNQIYCRALPPFEVESV